MEPTHLSSIGYNPIQGPVICFGEHAPYLKLTSHSSPVYKANVHACVLGCFSHVQLFSAPWTDLPG